VTAVFACNLSPVTCNLSLLCMFKFDLLENEKVITIYRQTEAVLFKPVLIIFALIYFPWYFLIKYGLVENYARLLFFWTALVFLYGIRAYFVWLLNAYIVTDKRLINIAHKSLLNKKVVETPLERILNVSFQIKGFWQSLFRFGTVEVQAAGLSDPLALKNVSQPDKVKDFLWKVHNRHSGGDILTKNLEIKHQTLAKSK
jgi:membrane protein YdbS with pleckstrin-like domain